MEIQKAKHLYLEMDKKKPAIDDIYMVFEKHDGWYGYMDFPSPLIHSRKHREIPSCAELSKSFLGSLPKIRGRLIFEIMIEGYEVDRFHELNGILNRKETAEDVYLMVHDFIPDFNFCTMSATKRYALASELVRRINRPEVRLSPLLIYSKDPAQWQAEAEKVWQRGGEGVILKAANAIYSPKSRISSLMKIKEECTVEMLVVGVVEGTGDHEGMAGKLICKDELGQKHEIGMGSATHDERREWLMYPERIKGQVAEIKAMKKLKDGSYREPRFKAVRYDKEVHELG